MGARGKAAGGVAAALFFCSIIFSLSGEALSNNRAASGAGNAGEPLKIGVSSMITPVDAVKYYQDIIDYIGERIDRPVQMGKNELVRS